MSHERDLHIASLTKANKFYRVTVIILSVLFLSYFLWVSLHNNKKDYKMIGAGYPLIDPAREFTPQTDFITNLQPLRDYLDMIGQREGNNISIYYEQLNSGANISVNKDTRFLIASLAKLPVAMVAMKKLETGTWNWDTDFKVNTGDLDSGSGQLYKNTDTTHYSFKDLLEALIIDSDNTAHNIFTRNFTLSDYQSMIDEIGLEDLFDSHLQASAKEYSRLLRSLYTSSYLERDGSEKVLDLMSQAKFKNFLSEGIPENITFAHKYGENTDEHIFADSGIVYVPGKPYMLTVIFKAKDGTADSEKYATGLMKEISTKAYDLGK